eukprot:356602-Chlamydomonas_euryale.AAC.13
MPPPKPDAVQGLLRGKLAVRRQRCPAPALGAAACPCMAVVPPSAGSRGGLFSTRPTLLCCL